MSNRRALPWHRTLYQGVPANARSRQKTGLPLSPAPCAAACGEGITKGAVTQGQPAGREKHNARVALPFTAL
jgi:hypothetical protein